jgi:hypothetical protein
MKRRPDPLRRGPDPAAIDAYIDALRAYLAQHGIDLIDFAADPRLLLEHYAVGDHLDRERGRPVFLPLLLEALDPHLADLR